MLRRSRRKMRIVGTAGSGRELLALLERCARCDVLLTDFSMPDSDARQKDGMGLMRTLRRRYPRLPIVVVTVLENRAILRALLNLGVTALVGKSARAEELAAATESAAAGNRYISHGLRERLAPALGTDPADRLSPNEIEVLRLLARGMSGKEVAAHLHRTSQTVSRQKRDAMRKLGLRNHGELHTYACDNGLLP